MESIRVDATLLQSHLKKTVRLVGKLQSKSLSDSTATLDSNGLLTLKFKGQNELLSSLECGNDQWYEVIGVVDDDLSVKVIQMLSWGTGINELAVKKMVEVTHKCPELFFTTS